MRLLLKLAPKGGAALRPLTPQGARPGLPSWHLGAAIDPARHPWDACHALLRDGAVAFAEPDLEQAAPPAGPEGTALPAAVPGGQGCASPAVVVVPLRLGDAARQVRTSAIVAALDDALRLAGDCTVLRLGTGAAPSVAWAEAVAALYEAGVTLVAAAGGLASAAGFAQILAAGPDRDGGAAAAALWLRRHRAALAGYAPWQRVEAVRAALATDAAPPPAALLQRAAAPRFDVPALRMPAEPGPPARQAMLELEARQILHRDVAAAAALAGRDPAESRPGDAAWHPLLAALAASPLCSSELRARLRGAREMTVLAMPSLRPGPSTAAPSAPRPARRSPLTPACRRLRILAAAGPATLEVPWEPGLLPGPVGAFVEVIDIDPARRQAHAPVDLDRPEILAQDGLAPAAGSPQFHQQMAYAVAMRTVALFGQALGRAPFWADRRHMPAARDKPLRHGFVRRLRIHPHALPDGAARYCPERVALLFGEDGAGGFGCLSQGLVARQTALALVDALHPGWKDQGGIAAAIAEGVALLQQGVPSGAPADGIAAAILDAWREVSAERAAAPAQAGRDAQPAEAVTARHLLGMLIRALDYCPPVAPDGADVLRAMLTADADLVARDPWGYRQALVNGFRRHGLLPPGMEDRPADALAWQPLLDPASLAPLGRLLATCWRVEGDRLDAWRAARADAARLQAALLGQEALLAALGLAKPGRACRILGRDGAAGGIEVHPIRPLRRQGPDGAVLEDIVLRITQRWMPLDGGPALRGGCTILWDATTRQVRHLIRAPVAPRPARRVALAEPRTARRAAAPALDSRHRIGWDDTRILPFFRDRYWAERETGAEPPPPDARECEETELGWRRLDPGCAARLADAMPPRTPLPVASPCDRIG